MKIRWSRHLRANIHTVLQDAGYHAFTDPRTHEESYIMRCGSSLYPRFHLYVTPEFPGETLDVHLDQIKHSLGRRRHAGEVDGDRVMEEAARLQRWFVYYSDS